MTYRPPSQWAGGGGAKPGPLAPGPPSLLLLGVCTTKGQNHSPWGQLPAGSSALCWPCADISFSHASPVCPQWDQANCPCILAASPRAQPSTLDLGSPGPVLSCRSLLVPGELGPLPGLRTPLCSRRQGILCAGRPVG